jgi:hypothetical protein
VKKQTIHSKCLVFVAGMLFAATPANADDFTFFEDFESYTQGMSLADQSDWVAIYQDVSSESSPTVIADPTGGGHGNVVRFQSAEGLRRVFGNGITSGWVTLEFDVYPPSFAGGELKVQPTGSSELLFLFGQVDADGWGGSPPAPIVDDTWGTVRYEIDLDNNLHSIYWQQEGLPEYTVVNEVPWSSGPVHLLWIDIWQEDWGSDDPFPVYIDNFSSQGPSLNTQPGSDVEVEPTDPYTGDSPATITFGLVVAPGETSVYTDQDSPGCPGCAVWGAVPLSHAYGGPAAYEILTTAEYDPSLGISICFDYAPFNLSPSEEAALRVGHYVNGAWDFSGSGSANTATKEICTYVTSLSPFALFLFQNDPPVAICDPTEITVDAENADGAMVSGFDGTQSYDPEGDPITFQWDASGVTFDDPTSATPSGLFPIGITTATLTVSDGNGGVDTCDVVVTVQDATPPDVMCTSDTAMLWPPNHHMRTVRIMVIDAGAVANPEDIIITSLTVSSDEPDDSDGDGSSVGDVNGEDGFASAVDVTSAVYFDPTAGENGAWCADIELRAERDGGEDGRCYTIELTAIDAAGDEIHSSCCIVVPHDRQDM